MKHRITAGLSLLSVSLGVSCLINLASQNSSNRAIPPASSSSIINLSNEMMERMIADGTYSKWMNAPDSTVLFRVNSGGPTRVPGTLLTEGALPIINPAGIVTGPASEPVTSKIDFHSTL